VRDSIPLRPKACSGRNKGAKGVNITMKEGFVVKTGTSAEITPEQLGKINRYSRRELSPGELYTFSVVLCDNEIDRDGERFTVPALKRLAALFVGKTGIFDHNPKGENQTARIFDTDLVVDREKKTSLGEPYTCVKASAYMIRSPKTEELIQHAISTLLENRTSFLIAHRLSTIRHADVILVVRGGKIIERGTHEELLKKGGYYADLHNKQFETEHSAKIFAE